MKNVDIEQAVAHAVALKPTEMTRKEKLLHWANLIRANRYARISLFHGLEYFNGEQLLFPIFQKGDHSVFGIAMGDPKLEAAGLKAMNEVGHGNTRQIMDFFELSQAQLHEFSCDCGGALSTEQMAQRIERIAGGSERVINGITEKPRAGLFASVFNRF